MPVSPALRRSLAVSGATVGLASLLIGYSSVIERNAFTVRQVRLPILGPGSSPLRILHISDIHMLPRQHHKQRWIHRLIDLEPHLVVNTGDNLAHPKAVPYVIQALGDLLNLPGVFVFGSNDYFSPHWHNPLRYLLTSRHRHHRSSLPWQDLRAVFIERGWLDLTHRVCQLTMEGQYISLAGVDDPHIRRDRYSTIAGKDHLNTTLRLGVVHSPEPHVLDLFADDGYQLVLAGHTHGGQIRIPGYGAIVTNSGLDRTRARGLSRWGAHMQLHVSAGLGTSPYAPIRFACRPEVTLLTLVENTDATHDPYKPTQLSSHNISV